AAILGFAEPTVPAGALVLRIKLRIRLSSTSGIGKVTSTRIISDQSATTFENTLVNWATPTTVTLGTWLTQAEPPTNLQVELRPGADDTPAGEFRCYALYLD